MLSLVADIDFPTGRELMATLVCYMVSIMTVQEDDICPDVCIKWITQLNPMASNECMPFAAAKRKLLPLVHDEKSLFVHPLRLLLSSPVACNTVWEILGDLVLSSESRNDVPLMQAVTAEYWREHANIELQFILKYILQAGDLDLVLSIYRFATKSCKWAGQFIVVSSMLREVFQSSVRVTSIVLKYLLASSTYRIAAECLDYSKPWQSQRQSTAVSTVIAIYELLQEPTSTLSPDTLLYIEKTGIVSELFKDIFNSGECPMSARVLDTVIVAGMRPAFEQFFTWLVRGKQGTVETYGWQAGAVFDRLALVITSLLTTTTGHTVRFVSRAPDFPIPWPWPDGEFDHFVLKRLTENEWDSCRTSSSWSNLRAPNLSCVLQLLSATPVAGVCELVSFLAYRFHPRLSSVVSTFCQTFRDLLNGLDSNQRCRFAMRVCLLRQVVAFDYYSSTDETIPVGMLFSVRGTFFLSLQEKEDKALRKVASELTAALVSHCPETFFKFLTVSMPTTAINMKLRQELVTKSRHEWHRLAEAVYRGLSVKHGTTTVDHRAVPVDIVQSRRHVWCCVERIWNKLTCLQCAYLAVFFERMHSEMVVEACELVRLYGIDIADEDLIVQGDTRETGVLSLTTLAIAKETNNNPFVFKFFSSPSWNRTIFDTIRDHPLFFSLFVDCLLQAGPNKMPTLQDRTNIVQMFTGSKEECFMSLPTRSRLMFLAALPVSSVIFVPTKLLMETSSDALRTTVHLLTSREVLDHCYSLELAFYDREKSTLSADAYCNDISERCKRYISSMSALQLRSFMNKCFGNIPGVTRTYSLDKFLRKFGDMNTMTIVFRLTPDWQHALRSLVFLFCVCQPPHSTEAADGSFYSLYMQPTLTDVKLQAMKKTWQNVLKWLNYLETVRGSAGFVAAQCKKLVNRSLPDGKELQLRATELQ